MPILSIPVLAKTMPTVHTPSQGTAVIFLVTKNGTIDYVEFHLRYKVYRIITALNLCCAILLSRSCSFANINFGFNNIN